METLFEGKKLYAVIIAFLFIITFFITFHIIRNHYQHVVKDTIAENTLKARFLSSPIYEHQKAAIGILESYAQRPLFIDAVKKKDFHRAIYHMKSLSEHHTEIDALFITDKSGTVWANYPVSKESYGKNLAYRDWYKGVSKKWRPYISTVFRLIVLEKDLAVAVSVPVLDRKGKVIGILGSTQRTPFLATFIKENIIDPKKSIALLDQEGNIIFSNTIPYQEKITKYPDAHVLEKAVAGVIIDMEIADAKERGSISYVSIAPVRGMGWSVIVGQEKNAILKSLYGYFIRYAVTGFVIFLFLTVSLLYFRREYQYRKTKELQASEKLYRTLFNEALDGICLADAETGIIIDCNQALEALVCRERAELIGQPQTILHPPQDDKKAFSLTFKQHLTDKQGQILETQVVTKTGDIREVEIKANLVVLHGRKLLQGLFCDITERKQAEEALREAGRQWQKTFDATNNAIWILDQDQRILRSNKTAERFFHRPCEELIGKHCWEIVHGTAQPIPECPILRARKSLRREIMELQIGEGWFEVTVDPILDAAGRYDGAVHAVSDITERKRAEEALRESEEKYRAVVEDQSELICRFLPGGTLTFVNGAYCRYFGRERAELVGRTFLPLIPEEDRQSIPQMQALISKENPVVIHEHRVILPDGQIRWQQWSNRGIFDVEGRLLELQAVGRDITERKRAEEALRENEERLRTIVEASLDAIIAVNVEGQLVLFNSAAQELFQYSEEEALNQPVDILLREEMGKIHQERLERFLKRGVGRCGHIGRRMEKLFSRKDGSLFEAEVSMSGGRLDGLRLVVLAIHDITSRKRAEDALRRSEENFRLSLEDSPLGARIVTVEGETIYANRAILDIYGFDSIEELKTTPVEKRYTPESYAEFRIRREKRRQDVDAPSEYTISIVRKNGEVRYLQVFRKEILWDGKRQFQVIYHDITERKRAEEALHASLREKELLLREVHHRVKNNMQVIFGLLDLQASSSGNPELIERLNESQSRIRSMALIHEKLYESKDFARIDLAGYVRTLSQELFQSHKINPGKIDLIVQTDGDVYVAINKAIPCGLILNELISNALKHAFSGDGTGAITVIISESDSKETEIVVRDNGLGLPDDVDIHQPRTVGLHLVNGLVKNQLDGQIEVRRDAGTEFRIKFPL